MPKVIKKLLFTTLLLVLLFTVNVFAYILISNSTGDRKLTATWKPDYYTITYNLNGGSITGQPTTYNAETPTFTLPIPTKANYVFAGWSGTNLTKNTQTVTVTQGTEGNLTYTANWLSLETNALKFSSDSNFTLSAPKNWDGVLEYTLDNGSTWTTWNGSQLSGTASQPIYLKGTGNTVISSNDEWTFTGKYCTGNIETLLDQPTVADGEHPAMANKCFAFMFSCCNSLTTAPELPATALADNCYRRMFDSCDSLTTAPELPATTLADNCYTGMFAFCYSLVTAPELPATTLAKYCYSCMFEYCNSLTTAPELPATTLASYCYEDMFRKCKSLTTAPELPATTLASYCYDDMFCGCSSLVTPPELPATTLASYCYVDMFDSCKSLKLSTTKTGDYQYEYRIPTTGTGTEKTATDPLRCMFLNTGGTFTDTPNINTTYYLATPTVQQVLKYAIKFSSDSNFTLSAPNKWDGTLEYTIDKGGTWNIWDGSELSGTATQPIYLRGTGNTIITGSGDNRWTFTGKYCTGNIENLLDYKTVVSGVHPTMGDYSFSCMFRGCSSLVTPPELPTTVLSQYCYNYMFADCTNLTTTPKLPATTLAAECYSQMFFACRSLTEVPELPATTLQSKCYRQMFYGCRSIKLSTTQTDEYQYAYRIPTTGIGTTASDALYRMFMSTGGTFTGAPSINTTYYTNNPPVK